MLQPCLHLTAEYSVPQCVLLVLKLKYFIAQNRCQLLNIIEKCAAYGPSLFTSASRKVPSSALTQMTSECMLFSLSPPLASFPFFLSLKLSYSLSLLLSLSPLSSLSRSLSLSF